MQGFSAADAGKYKPLSMIQLLTNYLILQYCWAAERTRPAIETSLPPPAELSFLACASPAPS